ncbi:diguanylate cyclase (GGDEF) domain-containing protein [Franzmannia pantelleriensis]|uniref:diguanylate cyclase n=1 Tax=Franzmannia pantelleriensis TaxID=48727 RepID=A0A1G9UWE8_9GAMM|nr:GGDEF domain-containing protein [Halomonas pantelleriensis]SDM64253.1 diguanylate cyclase (GGDEF) domain-containing protein [Halomonas pantelleriensis]
MPADDSVLPETKESLEQLKLMTERIPGMIFQLFRSASGQLRFPYLAGNATLVREGERRLLADDGSYAFERIDAEDFPRLMAAIERSAKSLTPLAMQFQLHQPCGEVRWISVRAQPEWRCGGTLWHGLMMDVSEQVAHEAHLRELSDTDELTGLANRRKLMCRLDEEISSARRHGSPLSLMLLDLDHFKGINDTWGHLQGDQVLEDLARLCQQQLREEDISARLGGEEFAMLLPVTPLSHCLPLAERLRKAIAAYDFGIGQGKVTASIGIAEYRLGEPRDAFIERADRGLYAAKHQGRNRVVSEP